MPSSRDLSSVSCPLKLNGMSADIGRPVKLPFPLTIKFKSMLQAGVATRDMDPQWMSSISWYVLCIFGLQSVFNYLLGSDNGKILSTPVHWNIADFRQPPVKCNNRWDKWHLEPERRCSGLAWTRTSNSAAKQKI